MLVSLIAVEMSAAGLRMFHVVDLEVDLVVVEAPPVRILAVHSVVAAVGRSAGEHIGWLVEAVGSQQLVEGLATAREVAESTAELEQAHICSLVGQNLEVDCTAMVREELMVEPQPGLEADSLPVVEEHTYSMPMKSSQAAGMHLTADQ